MADMVTSSVSLADKQMLRSYFSKQIPVSPKIAGEMFAW